MITGSRLLLSRSKWQRGSLILISLLLGFCATSIVGAQDIATPQYVGSQACAECHDDLANQFTYSEHSRLGTHELYGQNRGCESCHGPGSRHVETMDPADVVSFREASVKQVEQTCLNCHRDRVGFNWRHSEHSLNGVTCDSCHLIHQSRPALPDDPGLIERPARLDGVTDAIRPARKASLAKSEVQLCAGCHRDVVSKMMLPSRHPIREGKMECSSCHQVHGSDMGMLKTSERPNDMCLTCHTDKQGPFIFDHQPVTESCQTCHVPHGSVADNLLKQNEPFVCLQCHEAHFHIGREGLLNPNYVPSAGSDNPFGPSGWRVAFGTKCTQCHQVVHGSDLPSQTSTSQGKSLTR
jgi:predicted CXXCH cytochrome family protein